MNLAGREQHEHDKRIRAEVLAACIGHLREEANKCERYSREESAEYLQRLQRREASRYRDIAEKMSKLQPDAKDLEELLREAELDGRIKGHHFACLECQTEGQRHYMAELKKARAIRT